jgi:threonine synthase
MVAATAHPYKFADTVEPLIGATIEAPPALKAILGRDAHKTRIPPKLEALAEALDREPVA